MMGSPLRLSRAGFLILALWVSALILAGGALQAHASKASVASDTKTDLVTVASDTQSADPTLVLTRGMAEVVDIEGAVADVMVANPSIVDVNVLQANRLYLVGLGYGTTNLIAVDEHGDIVKRLNVHVKIDDTSIQSMLNTLFPKEDITVTAVNQQVVLTGHVSTPDVAQRVTNIVAQYVGEAQAGASGTPDEIIVNLLTVRGEQQVMLKVKVVEASREMLRELGVETNLLGNAVGTGANGELQGQFLTQAAAGLTADPMGIANVFYNNALDGFGPLQVIIRALEDEGLINTLAEPNLTAISGEEAGFLAGGEFPIPVSRDRDGNILVDYRPFGVALNFRPVVLSDQRISLQLRTEVSSISNQGDLSINQLSIPGFSVRRASTTVELGSGGSLMIAGLLQSEIAKSMSSVPGVSSLPIIGDLMNSESFQRQESELVVIVTAYLVKPYADNDDVAEEVPQQDSNPLAIAFADNIRRTYAKFALEPGLFSYDERYGYLIE